MKKILIAYEKDGPRYIVGDLGKAALMLLKERYDKYWYVENRHTIYGILVNDDWRRALKFLESRKNQEYEGFEIVECEEVKFLRPCPDITQRARELKEKCLLKTIKIHPIPIQDYLDDGREPPKEKDFCYITYTISDYYDYSPPIDRFTKEYLQDWFGDVKVDFYWESREIEVYR